MYKKHKVILLPTKDKTSVFLDPIMGDLIYDPKQTDKYILEGRDIYIISDEEIQKGDWVLSLTDDESFNEVYKWDGSTYLGEDKKIIAGTNKLIIGTTEVTHPTQDNSKNIYLPQIPEDFIQQYCNKNGIDEVEVEYEEKYDVKYKYIPGFGETAERIDLPDKLKISTDNKISIKQLKDNYSREEVEKLIIKITRDIFKPNSTITENIYTEKVRDWTKENL